MFSPFTQRLLWKEFRAQQAVWIAIAAELILLQLWWGAVGHRSLELNLFSLAFIMSGVFAMTTCALLFAGESEASTDLFLRQLPATPRQLTRGKLLYGGMAIVLFLTAAVISTLISAKMAGRFGGNDSTLMGDPTVFGTSIFGLIAWALFYSLQTRKVIWTVIGAAVTEVIISGFVHTLILSEFRFPEWVFFVTYGIIVSTVFAVDVRLLKRWCGGEARSERSMAATLSNSANVGRNRGALVADSAITPMSWVSVYRWSCFTGIVTVILLLTESFYSADRATSAMANAASTLLAVFICWAFSRFRSPDQPLFGWPQAVREFAQQPARVWGRLLAKLCGISGLAFGLGAITALSLVASTMDIVSLTIGPVSETGVGVRGALLPLLMAVGTAVAIWWGDRWVRTAGTDNESAWLASLRMIHSLRHRAIRRLGPLFWIEVRRAQPVLLRGCVLLLVIGVYRLGDPSFVGFSILAITIAALVCGLMTLLPDRTQGTLAFFAERGVSSTWILLSKLAVWWVTLLVMIIPLLVMRPDIWSRLEDAATPPYNNLPAGTDTYLLSAYAHNSPLLSAFGFLIGIFIIGALAAAWIRRPILATVAGIGMMLVWFFWYGTLMDCRAPKGFTAYLPVTLLGLGILGFGQSTLLLQATWRSRVCQVSWVLLTAFVGMQSFFHFRAHEVPDVSGSAPIQSLAASLPVSTGNQPSTFNGQGKNPADSAAYLDSIADDPELAAGLVQPPTYWGAGATFQAAISTLRLEDPDCNLDAAIKHLLKWHLVGEHLAQNSRDEDGWVDALFGKRVVLSAIRQWANHPNQTLERMDAAIAHMPVEFPSMSGGRVIARQHADSQRMLETGMAQDTGRPHQSSAGRPARWILTFTGEKERTRRLIDYYFYLSATTQVSQSPYSGIEFDHWMETSYPSVATFGVSLPWSRLNVRHRGQFELAWTAETVTRTVLRLQAWRLKHGSFPRGFAELFAQAEQFNINDYITNTAMHYEPTGFDRPLLAQQTIIIPAHQPLLYSEGISEPRGIEVSNIEEPDNSTGQMRTVFRYQARNAGAHHPSHMFNPVPQVINRTVQPNAIRFSVLGEIVDEDSLWRSKAAPDDIKTSSSVPPGQSSTMGAGTIAPNVSVPAEAPAPEAKTNPSQDIN